LVKLTIHKNESSHPRNGLISIEGNTLTIEQKGEKCVFEGAFDPSSNKTVPSGGEINATFSFAVYPIDCTTTAVDIVADDAGFPAVVPPSTGTGPGTIIYTVNQNLTNKTRSGKITLALDASKKKKSSLVK